MTRSVHLRGALCGLAAAALFGLSAPLAKRLLGDVRPLMLSGLLYAGGAVALTLIRAIGPRSSSVRLQRSDAATLVAITVSGGVVGPLLMLLGLQRLSGVAGALLLNLEGPLTIALALSFFGERLTRRAVGAALLIFSGAAVLSAGEGGLVSLSWQGAALIAGACLAWALDNNLTRRLSLRDPLTVVQIKAAGASVCSLALAAAFQEAVPAGRIVAGALAVGAASYGVSILLDAWALRLLGAAREAAFFATAPFIGAVCAVPLLGEAFTSVQTVAGAAMAGGVLLLIRDRDASSGFPATKRPNSPE